MREQFIDKRFQAKTLGIIDKINTLCSSYLDQGMRLTLRQLYYRFVASGWISNEQRSYDRLGVILNDARLAGLVDWNAIEDRGRNLASWRSWASHTDALNELAGIYREDLWLDQPCYVEVWVEKQALEGIVQRACRDRHAYHMACKGYMSQSEMYDAAKRFLRHQYNGQDIVLIHLGDHDPSGIDMTRDLADRLEMFGLPTQVERIALNMDQVDAYQPPPNPAKTTDSRFRSYVSLYGTESWELDALEPQVLHSLIQDTINRYIDEDIWQESYDRQEQRRESIESAIEMI